jgi:hypothetical protein
LQIRLPLIIEGYNGCWISFPNGRRKRKDHAIALLPCTLEGIPSAFLGLLLSGNSSTGIYTRVLTSSGQATILVKAEDALHTEFRHIWMTGNRSSDRFVDTQFDIKVAVAIRNGIYNLSSTRLENAEFDLKRKMLSLEPGGYSFAVLFCENENNEDDRFWLLIYNPLSSRRGIGRNDSIEFGVLNLEGSIKAQHISFDELDSLLGTGHSLQKNSTLIVTTWFIGGQLQSFLINQYIRKSFLYWPWRLLH